MCSISLDIFSHNVHELDYYRDRRHRPFHRIVRNNIDKHTVHEGWFCEFLANLNGYIDVDFEDEQERIRFSLNVECTKLFDKHEEEMEQDLLETKSRVNVVEFPENCIQFHDY